VNEQKQREQACEHWESGHPNYSGHCSHASCANYMDACPVHFSYGKGDGTGRPCTLEGRRTP